MPYVQVEVDLDDIDLQDMFNHIVKVAIRGNINEKKQIGEFRRTLALDPSLVVINNSKVDEWKDELWPRIKQKLSLEQLEALC